MSATSSRTSSRKKRLSPHSLQDTLAVGTVVRVTPNQFDFSLPIPPSINSQYATVNGRRVLSSTGRRYKTTVAQILLSEFAKSPNRSAFLNAAQSHYLSLTIHFYFPCVKKQSPFYNEDFFRKNTYRLQKCWQKVSFVFLRLR